MEAITQVTHKCEMCCNQVNHQSKVSLEQRAVAGFSICLSPLLGGFLSATVIISVMSQIPFCGPSGVDHFFCDFTPLLELSHTGTVTLMLFAVMTCFLDPILPFLFTWSSCVHQSCHPEEHLPSGAGRKPSPPAPPALLGPLFSMTPSSLTV